MNMLLFQDDGGSKSNGRRFAVDNKGDKPVTQIAAALFFLGLIAVLGVLLQHLLRENGHAIVAALRGEWQPDRPATVKAKSAVPLTRPRQWHAAA